MTVCALLVVVLLTQALDDSRFLDNDGEIKRILARFCGLLDRVARSASELELDWIVPFMPTGADLHMVVDWDLVTGESGGLRAHGEPMCVPHTWLPVNRILNRSIVEDMDRDAPALEAVSGQVLRVSAKICVIDNSEELLLFVSCQGQDRSENFAARSFTDSTRTSASSFVLYT